ncbi:ABC transporter permease [Burkholderia sp. Leaf177]|uniref:ABC transporter permease n=1 Tax=Burkholderia sp. Leaf177 TaxID=1736287 RepID=UPI0006FA4BEE|nr:ABC transporter permease [Burkholderia sp. Leaf177]KQR73691.1 ABC transporter permease [Burkholderia sp. Leaf177]
MELAMHDKSKAPRLPLKHMLGRNAGVASIAAFFIVCALAFTFTTNTFLTTGNLLNVLRQSAPLLIVATTMTLVITTGGIDLSIGSTLALVGAVSAIALRAGVPGIVVLLGGLSLGAIIGAINGYFIAFAGMPAFIVTLGTLSVVRGIALLITQGFSIPIENDGWFVELGRGRILGMPTPAVIAIVTLLCGFVTLRHTRFGRYVTGIGTNAEGVRRAGVNVRSVTMKVYVLSGAAAALAGLITTARLGSGSSNQGVGFELAVIAAVVLGSTDLFGGRGTILGTVLGALTIAVLGNGLILINVSPFYTQIIQGAIMLLAIWLNTRIFSPQRRKKA